MTNLYFFLQGGDASKNCLKKKLKLEIKRFEIFYFNLNSHLDTIRNCFISIKNYDLNLGKPIKDSRSNHLTDGINDAAQIRNSKKTLN